MNKSFLKTEVFAGLTTFLTMAYIVIVIPSVLSTAGTGIPFSGSLTSTIVLTTVMTLFMGIYAKLPYAIAPGIGLNAFFVYSLILGNSVPAPVALGIVFWAGVLFLLVALSPLQVKIAHAIPENLRIAAATGIGLFLTFIGLRNGGIVVSDPATLVQLGSLNQETAFVFVGFCLMTVLLRKKSPFAFLSGILLITGLSLATGKTQLPTQWWSKPDFSSTFFKADFKGALSLVFLPSIFTIFFTALFDSISTFVAISYSGEMRDKNGQPLRLREGMIVSAWGSIAGSILGNSPGTSYIESAAGIEAGGRSGWTAIVAGLLFLPCLFLAPIVQVIPVSATAPVLVLVGAMMFRNVKSLQFSQFEDLVPAFLTIVLIPLTFSITQGILWGLITHSVLYLFTGRRKELSPALVILCLISAVLVVLEL